MTLDFDQDLGAVEGALWDLGTHEEWLVAKRLFGSPDDCNLHDSLENNQRVRVSEENHVDIYPETESDTDSDSDRQSTLDDEDDFEADNITDVGYDDDEHEMEDRDEIEDEAEGGLNSGDIVTGADSHTEDADGHTVESK